MKKMKKIWYILPSLILTAPIAVSAQLTIPQGTGLSSQTVSGILTNTMQYLLYIVGILGVIGFVISGIFYLTAAGDEGQIKKAKSIMTSSITGIVVALLGVIILTAVKNLLTGTGNNI